MVLGRSGFRAGNIYMPGLDIYVDFKPDHYFRDDGPQVDMEQHRKNVFEEFGSFYEQAPAGLEGICLGIRKMGELGALIFITSNLSQEKQLMTYGHESAHALHWLGYHRELIECARGVGFKVNSLDNFLNHECVADLGRLIARKKLGFEVSKFQLNALVNDRSFLKS